MAGPELREKIKEIFCRQCDGISHADTCELDKAECPVLQTAPDQILALFDEGAIREKLDKTRIEIAELSKKLDDREIDLKEAASITALGICEYLLDEYDAAEDKGLAFEKCIEVLESKYGIGGKDG